MQTLIKKFKVDANENILLNKDILQAIEINFGKGYAEKLQNGTPIEIEPTILFDSDTEIKVKSFKEQEVLSQDTINGVFTYPNNNISELISTKATSGVLLITVY